MESHYLLNIARKTGRTSFYNGKHNPVYAHFAAVRFPASLTEEQAVSDTLEFAKRFPSSDGWQLDLTRWTGSGRAVPLPVETLDC